MEKTVNKKILFIGNWRQAEEAAKNNDVYILTDCPEYYSGIDNHKLFIVYYDISGRTGIQENSKNAVLKLDSSDREKWIQLDKKGNLIGGKIKDVFDMNDKFDLIIANPPYNIGNQIISNIVDKAKESVVLMPASCYKGQKLWKKVKSIEIVDPKLFPDASISDNLSITAMNSDFDSDLDWDAFIRKTYNSEYLDFYELNAKSVPKYIYRYATMHKEHPDVNTDFMVTRRTIQNGTHKTSDCADYPFNVEFDIDKKGIPWDELHQCFSCAFLDFPSKQAKINFSTFWYNNPLMNNFIKGMNSAAGRITPAIPNIDFSIDRDYENCTLEDIMKWIKEDNNL